MLFRSFSPDTPREDAFTYWFGSGAVSHVAEAYVMYRVLDEVE